MDCDLWHSPALTSRLETRTDLNMVLYKFGGGERGGTKQRVMGDGS